MLRATYGTVRRDLVRLPSEVSFTAAHEQLCDRGRDCQRE